MALENLLGISDPAELARKEERISKANAVRLFEEGLLEQLEKAVIEAILRESGEDL